MSHRHQQQHEELDIFGGDGSGGSSGGSSGNGGSGGDDGCGDDDVLDIIGQALRNIDNGTNMYR